MIEDLLPGWQQLAQDWGAWHYEPGTVKTVSWLAHILSNLCSWSLLPNREPEKVPLINIASAWTKRVTLQRKAPADAAHGFVICYACWNHRPCKHITLCSGRFPKA